MSEEKKDRFTGVNTEALKDKPDMGKIKQALQLRKALTEDMKTFKDETIDAYIRENVERLKVGKLTQLEYVHLERGFNLFYTGRVAMWAMRYKTEDIKSKVSAMLDEAMSRMPKTCRSVIDVPAVDSRINTIIQQNRADLKMSSEVLEAALQEWLTINQQINDHVKNQLRRTTN